MSQNLQDEIEHIDFTDYYSDIKKGASDSKGNQESERLDTNESENLEEKRQEKKSSSNKKRCQECEKCDLDAEYCNHIKDKQ